jgi:hypothetical protein
MKRKMYQKGSAHANKLACPSGAEIISVPQIILSLLKRNPLSEKYKIRPRQAVFYNVCSFIGCMARK